MNIKKIPNGKWKQNCYIITNDFNETIIIDPGSEDNIILEYCETKGENILAILNTHGHYDHVGGIKILKERYRIPLYMHSSDERLMKSANLYMKLFEGTSVVKIPEIDFYLDKIEDSQKIGNFSIKIFQTPGHTNGGVSFLINNSLFSGDTILKGKIGRVDLPGGDIKKLKESILNLSKLPKEIRIFPGHDGSTTIGGELKNIEGFLNT